MGKSLKRMSLHNFLPAHEQRLSAQRTWRPLPLGVLARKQSIVGESLFRAKHAKRSANGRVLTQPGSPLHLHSGSEKKWPGSITLRHCPEKLHQG
jgi:hypothetical protein